ncbi:hypothetical protein [Rubellimicrobium roseum]|uniref:Uncharacterized protein n=1 Tax=Rubellimicrobium roseum TaxID=687525 RepID=A0A5C4NER6_9RHOB|nr:hypothetical protein [Rubellimicrobium roseum]TNC70363.1 hypothetical protein FHG71_13285 [Rubellimicrobium roseum]
MRLSPARDPWSVRRHAQPTTAIGLTAGEVADYGLSPSEVLRLARLSPDQIARRNAMARLNGLDPARLEEDRALDIATALCCVDCTEAGGCRLAVAEGSLPESADFCANSDTWRTLAAE